MSIPPETRSAIITFLISIGTIAAAELKEIWAFRRNEKTKEVNLSDEKVAEQELPSALESFFQNLNEGDLNSTLDLVQRRQKLVYEAKRAKLISLEEYNKGKITKNELILQEEDSNDQIRALLQDTGVDFQRLGLNIYKSTDILDEKGGNGENES